MMVAMTPNVLQLQEVGDFEVQKIPQLCFTPQRISPYKLAAGFLSI
jgi:hypothetical protein